MLRSTTTLAILLLLVASPCLAQTTKEAPPPEGISVAYAWVTGLPGLTVGTSPVTHDIAMRPKLAFDLPTPKPVPLSHLDFGAYEPYAPSLARRVLPNTPNDTDPFQLTLNGNPGRTTIGTKVQGSVANNVAVRAKATASVPGVAALGDRAAKWRPAPDLKVDVRYKF